MMRRPEASFDALDRFLHGDACEQGFYVKTDEDLVRLDGRVAHDLCKVRRVLDVRSHDFRKWREKLCEAFRRVNNYVAGVRVDLLDDYEFPASRTITEK